MHPSVVQYLEHLKTERNSSVHTLRCYEDDLVLFCQFLSEGGGGAGPDCRGCPTAPPLLGLAQ